MENNEGTHTCYNGENMEEWTRVVQAINAIHIEVFPNILTKDNNQAWLGVEGDFPRREYEQGILVNGILGFQWIDENLEVIDFTSLEAAPREEKSALEIFNLTSGLMRIVKERIKVNKQYDKIIDKSKEIKENEFNNSVLIQKIKYQNGNTETKDRIRTVLLEKSESYDKIKSEFDEACRKFENMSQELANIESVPYSADFNKNIFLNFHIFNMEHKIDEKNYKDYLIEQRFMWNEVLNVLDDQSVARVSHKELPKEKPEENKDRIKLKNESFQLELRNYKEVAGQVELELVSSSLVQLKRDLKEIEMLHNGLQTYMKDPEMNIGEPDKIYIKGIRKLLNNLDMKIDDKENKLLKETEKMKADATANIRSLKTVSLAELNGFDDFLAWRKSQKVLNTHTNDFKKARALISTLKNKDDIEMCQGIYDYDVLMSMLEDKYAHADMIIPKMLEKLKKLPNGTSNEIMLKNITTIINIYEQIKAVGKEAINMFDQTVIDQLKLKLTFSCQTRFARYKILRADEPIEQLEDNMDNMSLVSGIDRLQKPNENSHDVEQKRNEFIKFIKIESRTLNETLTRNNTGAKPKKCFKCKNVLAHCKCKGNHNKRQDGNRQDAYNVQHSGNGKKCPVPSCGSTVPHLNRYQKPSTSLGRCPKYKEMSQDERQKLAYKLKACFVCLSIGHTKEDCKIKTNCYNCEKDRHHPLLCKDPSKFGNSSEEANTASTDNNARVLLLATKGEIASKTNKMYQTNILFDNGATCNFILNKLAVQLGYTGIPAELSLTKVGNSTSKTQTNTKIYTIMIKNNKNKSCSLNAYGVDSWDKIASDRTSLDQKCLQEVSKRFGISPTELNNVSGEVGLLIGMKNLALHPKQIKENGDLILYKSMFGKRFVLGGQVDGNVGQNAQHTAYHVEISNQSYWTGDQLGLNTDPKCSTCLKAPQCKTCLQMNLPLTFKEQEEGKLIRSSMTFDKPNKEIRVSYPYNPKIDEVFSPKNTNKPLAERMAQNLFKSLIKDNLLETYTENFIDMEKRGAIRELTEEEMAEWETNGNPVNYCSHHAVLKDSKSTACRSVCNSSLKHNGTTLNLLLPKGPKALSNLLHVLMRFRMRPYVVICDLKKAYNSIKTSLKDCHLRRLMWYRLEDLSTPNPKLRTFGMECMAFGDTPAQAYLEYAKEGVSDYIKNDMKEPSLASDMIKMSYVDDIALSLETEAEAEEYAQKLPTGFGSYGFRIKEIFIGGKDYHQKSEHAKQLLFGHLYDLNNDTIELRFSVNFSSKKRSQKTGPNLTSESDLTNLVMTKRKVMSLVSSQYDPLGLVSIFLAKYKIFLARLFKSGKYDWDTNLCPDDNKVAINLVKEMINAAENSPTFERSTKPENYTMEKLIVFVDASTVALQVVVYGLYMSQDRSQVYTSLITAKNKIANSTVPRNELQSMVAGHRLTLNVLDALEETPSEIIFLGDSTCTLDFLRESYVTKDIYLINRIAEIKKSALKMKSVVKYYHIPTKLNIADHGTREECKFELLHSKEWQHGPEFLKDIDSVGKLKITINHEETMYIEGLRSQVEEDNMTENFITKLIEIKSFESVVNILTIILLFLKRKIKSYKTELDDLASVRRRSKQILYRLARPDKEKIKSIQSQFDIREDENGTYLLTRPFDIEKKIINFEYVLLDGSTIVGKSILKSHHIHVSSVEREISKLLDNKLYVMGARGYLKRLQKSCHTCKRIRQEISKSKMGPSPILQAKQGGPMSQVVIDMWGPFTCKISRNTTKKGYFLTTSCLYTRYTTFQLMLEGTADSLLMALKQTVYQINGRMPTKIYSDSGRNILPIKGLESSAEPESGLDISTVANMMQSQGIELKTSTSAPWRQTAAESLHRVLRLNLKRSGISKGSKYSIPQWNYIASAMTYQINQRPICIKYMNENLLSLSPAKLIFGVAEGQTKLDMDLGSRKLFKRLKNLETELQEWRKLWEHTYLQEMKKCRAFKNTQHPLDVGSVVLITDHVNKETGLPALGRVCEKLSDRSFVIQYNKKPAELSKDMKIVKPSLVSTMERPAQRLVHITNMNNNLEEFNIDPFDIDTSQPSILPEIDNILTANNHKPEDEIPKINDMEDFNLNQNDKEGSNIPIMKSKPIKIQTISECPKIVDIKTIKKSIKKHN